MQTRTTEILPAPEFADRERDRTRKPRVSVVIPCLNEAETIAECVARALAALEENALEGEVIVVDNGSTDGSGELARRAGARVVDEPRRGYGSAYLAGLAVAVGDFIVMVDADLTYDFGDIPKFVRELEDGADVVIGNRMADIRPGAMPLLSRIGNPLLSGFLNVLHRTNIHDAHSGMRALRRDVLPILNLRTVGMEFASEMVIRATREHLDVREVPIALHPRVGRSKLEPLRDGWRHLRVILVYNPTFLFLLPGLVMLVAGSLITLLVFEHGLALALVFGAAGLALLGLVIAKWAESGFGTLKEQRLAILATTVVAVST